MRHLFPLLLALGLAGPVAAETCSTQLLRSVEARMPPMGQPLDPADLSCAGLTEVYLILQDDSGGFGGLMPAWMRQRQRIETVFRREGLIR